jgi:hypothetical protein
MKKPPIKIRARYVNNGVINIELTSIAKSSEKILISTATGGAR